jgi:hypothetical protein
MLLLGLILSVVICMVIFVAPASPLYICIFIVLITMAVKLSLSQLKTKGTTQWLATIFIFVFLSMNALIGFEIVNTLLLASFIIGLRILLP